MDGAKENKSRSEVGLQRCERSKARNGGRAEGGIGLLRERLSAKMESERLRR